MVATGSADSRRSRGGGGGLGRPGGSDEGRMLADEKARFDDLHYYNGQDIIVTLPTPMTGLATNSFFSVSYL